VPAPRRRKVDLPHVVEAKEVAQQAAVPDERIEGRQEGDRWGRIGVPHPRRLGVQERRLVGEEVARVAQPLHLGREQDPIVDEPREVTCPLRRLAGAERDLSGERGPEQPHRPVAAQEPMAPGLLGRYPMLEEP